MAGVILCVQVIETAILSSIHLLKRIVRRRPPRLVLFYVVRTRKAANVFRECSRVWTRLIRSTIADVLCDWKLLPGIIKIDLAPATVLPE